MKPRYLKLQMALFAACMAAAIGGMIYFSYLSDRSMEVVNRGAEVMRRCTRLRLKMTRDEAIQLMGPPLKEYEVRPQGKERAALYKEMIFKMPLSGQPAYVDLDLDTSRVIEIFCSQNANISLSLPQRNQLKHEESRPLPSDRGIPSLP